SAAPVATVERRRSLAAARVYLQDMLELQHGLARARALRHALLEARDEAGVLAAMGQALQELPQFTSSGYSERVHTRVLEALPDAARAQLLQRIGPGGTRGGGPSLALPLSP
ncbi:MAG: hypothetical protein QM601_08800, partial [Pseudoxanthomonas sp.]